MRRKLIIAGVLLGVVGAFGLLQTSPAHALNARAGDDGDTTKEEVVESSIFRSGRVLSIDGTIRGDVYCLGQQIEIKGTVEGDVLCTGQDVRITGLVKGDVRTAGQTIVISGNIEGNVSTVSQSLTLEDKASISGDLAAAGQNIRLAGRVGRDAVLAGNLASHIGSIGRDADFFLEKTSVYETAVIGGNLTYTSAEAAKISPEAKIAGRTEHKTPPAEERRSFSIPFISPLFMLVSMILALFLWLLIIPQWFKRTTDLMRKDSIYAVGAGFVALFMVPVLCLFVLFTVVGIPFAVAGLALWALAVAASFSFSAYTLGRVLTGRIPQLRNSKEVAAIILGSLVLVLLLHIPFAGIFVGLLAVWWGLGGICISLFRSSKAQHVTPHPKAAKE